MNYAELIEFYNEPILIGRPDADKYLIMAAQMMAEEENNMLLRRHKPKTNNYSELLELYMTPVPAVREEEEPITKSKETDMAIKCELCGKTLGYYDHQECGRPLVNGVVCKECKVKCRNYEDDLKAKMPDSIRYWPYPSDVEDD